MTQLQRRGKGRNNAKVSRFGGLLGCLMAAMMLSASGTAGDGRALTGSPAVSKSAGRLLVASPRMRDPRFAETVIFLVRHDERGAQGLIVNRLIAVEPAAKILELVIGKNPLGDGGRAVRIQYGGPVRTRQWTFVHSNDYAGKGTTAITGRVSITSNPEILLALAKGEGPAKGFFAIGYAGWGPGQLENEIRRKDWVTIPPDDALVLDDDLPSKWRRAMEKQTVDL